MQSPSLSPEGVSDSAFKQHSSASVLYPPTTSLVFLLYVGFAMMLCWLASGYYFSADDPVFLYSAKHRTPDIQNVLVPVGRWLNSYLLLWSLRPLHGIADLALLRVTSALFVVVLAIVLALLLVRLGTRFAVALLITLVAMLNPSTAVMVAWAQHVTVTFGAILITGAAHLVLESERQLPAMQVLRLLAAAMLTYAAASINQSLLGFWGVFVALFAFYAEDTDKMVNSVARSLLVVFLACGLMFVTVSLAHERAPRAALANDLFGKVRWFLREPLPNAAQLGTLDIFAGRWGGYAVVLAVLALVVSTTTNRLLAVAKGGVFAGSLVLAYLPNLLVSENWASYRTIWPLSIMFLLMLALGLSSWIMNLRAKGLTIVLLAVWAILLGGLWVHQAEVYFREPLSREAATAVRELGALLAKAPEAGSAGHPILIVIPHWTENIPGLGRYDDVGPPQTRVWTGQSLVSLMSKEFFGLTVPADRVEVVDFEDRNACLASGRPYMDMSNYAGHSRLQRATPGTAVPAL